MEDQGNQSAQNGGGDNDGQEAIDKEAALADLLCQLKNQIECFERLPEHIRFSPCTHADLAYFMMLTYAISQSLSACLQSVLVQHSFAAPSERVQSES